MAADGAGLLGVVEPGILAGNPQFNAQNSHLENVSMFPVFRAEGAGGIVAFHRVYLGNYSLD